MALNMSPSELDPVFAADTPITPDPTMRPRPSAASPRDQAHRALIAQLIAQGYPPAEAAALAARQMVSAEMDSFKTPPSQPVVAAPTPDDMEPMTADQLRDGGRNPYMEPGPNMPDGSKAAGPRQMMTEREADAYNIRTPNDSGSYNPSPRDDANAARGLWPVFTPSGEVSYSTGTGNRPMYSDDPGNPVGAPGRLGPRRDLEPGFNLEGMPGPTGQVYVYRQNQAAKDRQSAYMKERQLYRDAEIQGVSPASLLAQSPELAEELTAGGQRDRVGARAANEGARQAAAAKREEAWRAQMMLGGGRPTGGIGGSKAVVNALESLPDDQRNSSLRYMLPGGQLSATVDANNASQAGRMAQAAMTAFLNNNPNGGQLNPLQQQQLNQMQSQLPPAEQVPIHKDKPGVHPAELKYADDYVSTHYSSGGGMFGTSSGFTLTEQQAAIDHLVNDMGYAPAKAQKIVDEIARRRNAGSWMGSPVNPATGAAAPPAAPGPPAPPARGDI